VILSLTSYQGWKMWKLKIVTNGAIFYLLMDFTDIKGQCSDMLGLKRTCFVSPKVILAPAWTAHFLVLKISGPKNRDYYFQDLPSFEIK